MRLLLLNSLSFFQFIASKKCFFCNFFCGLNQLKLNSEALLLTFFYTILVLSFLFGQRGIPMVLAKELGQLALVATLFHGKSFFH